MIDYKDSVRVGESMNVTTTALNPAFSPGRRGTVPRVRSLTNGQALPLASNELEYKQNEPFSRGRRKGEGGQFSPANTVDGFNARSCFGKFSPALCWLVWLAILAGYPCADAGAAESPWNRIVIIGASASAGFVLTEPLGGPETTDCKLRFYLDAAITAPHAQPRDYSTALMFMNPDALGPQQVDAAVAARPTLVIGVDFLFWSCYGGGLTDAGRLQHFEAGLKLLDQLHCPLVIGDIPDASAATNTGIISADMVADAAVRAAANHRLKTWAASHPGVAIVPLADFMRRVAANQAVIVRGRKFAAGKTRAFLQDDALHPTPRGAALLALGIFDALVKRDPEFPASEIRWNQTEVYRLGDRAAHSAP